MPTTDLATITFEGDARLTLLQVLSVDRLFDPDSMNRYIIVLNGANNSHLKAWLLGRLRGVISSGLLEKIDFVEAREVIGAGTEIGWRDQQLIKLKVADLVATDHYLLLDGKNHFVHRATAGDFFVDGSPATNFTRTNDSWLPFVRASLDVFGANDDLNALTTPPTITPYVMIRAEVLALLARLESIYQVSASDAFDKELRRTTEFYLYYAHLVSTGRSYPYQRGPTRVTTLYTKWPQDPDVVMRLITSAHDLSRPVFGLHRLRIPQLNDHQRAAITELWLDELLETSDRPEWFLQTAAIEG